MSDIFDKVSDAITSTANNISDKAREVSEVTALRGKIRSQNKVIENAYIEIGKQYYEAHKEAEGDDYAELIGQITAAHDKIELLEQDIENIRKK